MGIKIGGLAPRGIRVRKYISDILVFEGGNTGITIPILFTGSSTVFTSVKESSAPISFVNSGINMFASTKESVTPISFTYSNINMFASTKESVAPISFLG